MQQWLDRTVILFLCTDALYNLARAGFAYDCLKIIACIVANAIKLAIKRRGVLELIESHFKVKRLQISKPLSPADSATD